ncbi:hypothetical protein OHA74_54180 [Streptomyces phaeochromogenes]
MCSDQRAEAPRDGPVCPACNSPVTAEITRHKTMGVFVPVWKPGPCHTLGCPEFVPEWVRKEPNHDGPEQQKHGQRETRASS